MAVNCGVELARLSKQSTIIVDLKPGLGEVALFLGVRPRYSLLDAIDNLHRLDREFLQGARRQAQVGARDPRRIGSISIVPARRTPAPSRSCSGCWRGSTSTSSWMPAARSIRARWRRCTPPTACFWSRIPTCPSVRNAQRLLERVRQLGACGERVRLLLNRAAEPYPIPPKQIEAALGHPDSPHVSERLQDRVSPRSTPACPLALSGDSDIANQFALFTQRVLDPTVEAAASPAGKKGLLSLDRIASIW